MTAVSSYSACHLTSINDERTQGRITLTILGLGTDLLHHSLVVTVLRSSIKGHTGAGVKT